MGLLLSVEYHMETFVRIWDTICFIAKALTFNQKGNNIQFDIDILVRKYFTFYIAVANHPLVHHISLVIEHA